MKKPILIFRSRLLPYSETFITNQVRRYHSFDGFYAGHFLVDEGGSTIPSKDKILLSDFVRFPVLWQRRHKYFGLIQADWFRKIRELAPRLVHAHFGPDGVQAIPLAKKLGVPLIVTFHGYDASSYPVSGLRNLRKRKYKQLFGECHKVIAVSDFIRGLLIDLGCPPEKIAVNYLGVDVDKFSPSSDVLRSPVVLFAGRLVEKKGCGCLIEAMAQIQKSDPQIGLVVIGDGPLRKPLERQAQRLLQNVRFLGWQPREIVRLWMNQAMVFCAPSITSSKGETEGLPLTILEAQAMGVPVVSTWHAGIPEAVADRVTGLLVGEKDTEGIVACIQELFGNSLLRQELAAAAREQIEEKFSMTANVGILEDVYRHVLSDFKN